MGPLGFGWWTRVLNIFVFGIPRRLCVFCLLLWVEMRALLVLRFVLGGVLLRSAVAEENVERGYPRRCPIGLCVLCARALGVAASALATWMCDR